ARPPGREPAHPHDAGGLRPADGPRLRRYAARPPLARRGRARPPRYGAGVVPGAALPEPLPLHAARAAAPAPAARPPPVGHRGREPPPLRRRPLGRARPRDRGRAAGGGGPRADAGAARGDGPARGALPRSHARIVVAPTRRETTHIGGRSRGPTRPSA